VGEEPNHTTAIKPGPLYDSFNTLWKEPSFPLCYTVKKVTYFPVPSRDVTNQTLPGREQFNYSRPWRVWLVTSRLGRGKSLTFFYREISGFEAKKERKSPEPGQTGHDTQEIQESHND
jgi:hypothetical protein